MPHNAQTNGQPPGRTKPSSEAWADDSRVVAALQEFLKLQDQKDPLTRSHFLARHADITEPLTAALDGLKLMNHVASGIKNLPPPPKVARAEPAQGSLPLGDFQIIREIGRGGMGVVYEAEQLSLGRRVALKVLPFAAALDGKQLARFKNEAYAAAHLHHTNIVPVFAVGSDRGVHYYAMQFIDGHTLADFIRERRMQEGAISPTGTAKDSSSSAPSPAPVANGASAWIDILAPDSRTAPYLRPNRPIVEEPFTPPPASVTRPVNGASTQVAGSGLEYFKSLARWGRQAAEALEYAHSMGVVHRDIKPANMLIDSRGHLWVTDFGLAHFRQNADLTLSGDLVGTARYMSPEQTRGERSQVDLHTDIYSLGATLYELFTLRHAFDGRGGNELLRQIAHDEPVPLRKVRPEVPAELEVIVQKAMAKNPLERYRQAADLAEDLRRFIDDQPILARRPSPWQVATKWARRHRPLLYSVFGLLVVALLGLSWFYWRLYHETLAREAAMAKGDRAERMARQAVDQMYVEFGERWLRDQPHLLPVHREFLDRARDFYRRFSRLTGQSLEMRQGRVNALCRVAEIEHKFGNYADAAAAFAEVTPQLRQLAADFPNNLNYQRQLAHVLSQQGLLQLDTGSFKLAVESLEQAVAVDSRLLPIVQHSDRWNAQLALAMHTRDLASAFQRLRQFNSARQYYSASLQLFQGLQNEAQETLRHSEERQERKLGHFRKQRLILEPELARLHLRWGLMLSEAGQQAEAETHWQPGLALTRELAEAYPYEHQYKCSLGEALKMIGKRCHDGELYRNADSYLRQALSVNEQLANATEFDFYYREVAECLGWLARVAKERDCLSEAMEYYRREIEIRDRLSAGNLDEMLKLAVAKNNLGHVLLEAGQAQGALEAFQEAIAVEVEQFDRFAKAPRNRHRLAVYRNNVAKALWQLAKPEQADDSFREALALSEEVLNEMPGQLEYKPMDFRATAARLHRNYAVFLVEQGRLRDAEDQFRSALAQEHKLRAETEGEPRWHVLCVETHQRLAWLYEQQRQPGLAMQEFQRARQLLEDLTTLMPKRAVALSRRAWFLASVPDATCRDYDRAEQLLREIATAEAQQDSTHADVCRTQGLVALRRGQYDLAVTKLKEACERREKRDSVSLMLLALAYAQDNELKPASACYEQAMEEYRRRPGLEPEFQAFRGEFLAKHGARVAKASGF